MAIQLGTTNLSTGRRFGRPAVAGAVYVGAWLIGLTAAASAPALDAPASDVLAHYADHGSAAMASAVLVHGVAAVALGTVAVAIGRRWRAGRATMTAGLVAAGLSLGQLVLDVLLAGPVGRGSDAHLADQLFDAVNRMDGVKMFALAAMALFGAGVIRRPRWMPAVSVATGTALVASGVGYALLANGLGMAAAISLPLLLVWVATAGVAAGRD